MTIERDIYNAMNRCSKTGIIGVFKNGTIAFIMQLSIGLAIAGGLRGHSAIFAI
jgi:hypothetical protein